MRILLSLALSVIVLVGLVMAIAMAGAALAGSAGKAFEQGPVQSGLVPRIAFILLWLLVFGTSAGLIGAN
ncbi:hypothetical protein [Tropicimonas sp. IMCC34043]|uniref:hypothetical protein n=1 Tax=Tropicimonas sp. IMCC34043 TaxID=2248760 RepID=UPI000E21E1A9|nr:hypothetical protein [Tropicimonas sp. IMCC34043]